ncbi:MAG: 4-hydroxy-3-methylbut-2-enyl diphosphate reductase, partial [Rikenellaceae bacterium]|nr:4-hydroxy-3-methylbut-2-enyl diphosphate reductase [Rikenellaceae bacterium]
MRVEIDSRSGFCFGVVRAIEMAEQALKDSNRVWSLGDIVHNRDEVERLRKLGLETIDVEQLNDSLRGEHLLIRA